MRPNTNPRSKYDAPAKLATAVFILAVLNYLFGIRGLSRLFVMLALISLSRSQLFDPKNLYVLAGGLPEEFEAQFYRNGRFTQHLLWAATFEPVQRLPRHQQNRRLPQAEAGEIKVESVQLNFDDRFEEILKTLRDNNKLDLAKQLEEEARQLNIVCAGYTRAILQEPVYIQEDPARVEVKKDAPKERMCFEKQYLLAAINEAKRLGKIFVHPVTKQEFNPSAIHIKDSAATLEKVQNFMAKCEASLQLKPAARAALGSS